MGVRVRLSLTVLPLILSGSIVYQVTSVNINSLLSQSSCRQCSSADCASPLVSTWLSVILSTGLGAMSTKWPWNVARYLTSSLPCALCPDHLGLPRTPCLNMWAWWGHFIQAQYSQRCGASKPSLMWCKVDELAYDFQHTHPVDIFLASNWLCSEPAFKLTVMFLFNPSILMSCSRVGSSGSCWA